MQAYLTYPEREGKEEKKRRRGKEGKEKRLDRYSGISYKIRRKKNKEILYLT